MIKLIHGNSLVAIKKMQDNQFDLAIVDPPYGIGFTGHEHGSCGKKVKERYTKKEWDNEIPTEEYFKELFRVSKNQMILGGNYMINYLKPTPCFVIWDKKQPEQFSMAMCEFAWTSFTSPAKIFRSVSNQEKNRFHPTQKPVKLYKWLLQKYAKKGDTILDTHLGSGSIAIACHDYGFDLVGYELDKEYYDKAVNRLNLHKAQLRIF